MLVLWVVLWCLLSLTACQIGGGPEVPEVPASPPVATPPPPPAAPAPEPVVQTIVYMPEPVAPPPDAPPKATRPTLAPKAERPAVLIPAMQRAAQVGPSRRGYFGGSNTHRYVWQPQKTYIVYVSPTQGTKLVLPPGEVLANQPLLDPAQWDMGEVLVSKDEIPHQSIILIRPKQEEGQPLPRSVDVAFVSQTGRSFDVHLVPGDVAMFAVTWELPAKLYLEVEEPLWRAQ